MKTYTLGFLFRNRKIILAAKKRKIGIGKLNGYGGRVEEGEDRMQSLIREIFEECSVIAEKENCKELGYIDFYFQNAEGFLRVYVYRIDEFFGEPVETEEMGSPEEFDLNEIPYHRMMVGDEKFIPLVVQNKKFKGEVNFSTDGEKLVSCVLE